MPPTMSEMLAAMARNVVRTLACSSCIFTQSSCLRIMKGFSSLGVRRRRWRRSAVISISARSALPSWALTRMFWMRSVPTILRMTVV